MSDRATDGDSSCDELEDLSSFWIQPPSLPGVIPLLEYRMKHHLITSAAQASTEERMEMIDQWRHDVAEEIFEIEIEIEVLHAELGLCEDEDGKIGGMPEESDEFTFGEIMRLLDGLLDPEVIDSTLDCVNEMIAAQLVETSAVIQLTS